MNRKVFAVLFILVIALGTVWLLASNNSARAAQETRAPVAAPAPVSAATDSIQLLGTFVAPSQTTLAFRSAGRISSIAVQEGAQVKAGDSLAQLETTDSQLNIAQAQAALKLAQDRLTQIKNGPTAADAKAAQAALDAAQASYDKLKAGPTASDLAAAQAALDAAQKNYAKVKAGPTADDLAFLQAQVDNAKAALDQAQAAYDKIGGASNPNIALAPQTKALQQATNNYNAAVAALNNAKNHPTAAELAAALGQVQQAQAALARLTPDAAQLAAAAAQLQQAQAAVARLQPTSDNLTIAQDQVDQAQAALALAQQQLANATLTAPSSGTVLWIGPHAGDLAAPGTLFAIVADLSHWQMQAGVDQNALAQLQVGQSVTIVPDAFRDQKLTGKISRIGWMATTTAGVINVPVMIDVDATTLPLRPGLSAQIEIQP